MKTKDKIIETTFLLSLKYGYNNVSIKQIKDSSKIAASSIYHHFRNKDEILSHLVNKHLITVINDRKEFIKNIELPLIKKLEIIFYYSVGIDILNNKKSLIVEGNRINTKEYYLMFTGIYHQNPEYRHLFIDAAENILNLLKELIDEAKNKKEINCNIDSKEISFFIFSNMRGIVDIWINSNYKADQLIDSNLKIIKKVIK